MSHIPEVGVGAGSDIRQFKFPSQLSILTDAELRINVTSCLTYKIAKCDKERSRGHERLCTTLGLSYDLWSILRPLVYPTTLGLSYDPRSILRPLVYPTTLGLSYDHWSILRPLVYPTTLGLSYDHWSIRQPYPQAGIVAIHVGRTWVPLLKLIMILPLQPFCNHQADLLITRIIL